MSATSNWLDFSGNSNLSNPTYMIGFLDISSGNVILRNSNLFLKSGDASLGGRLFVNGDVSLNGRLYAPINSIPASAIIGGGGATFTNTQGSFASNNSVVTMTLDVSAANTLDVSGIMAVSTALGVGVTNPQYQVDVGGGGIGCGRMAQFGAGGAATTPANNITTNIITGTFTGPITTTGDASLNGRLFVGTDSSLNGSVAVGGNLTVNGNLSVKAYTQQNVLNTITTNTFSVIEDLSLNGRILVSGDASLNGRLFVGGNVGIGTSNPAQLLEVYKTGAGATSQVNITSYAGAASTTNTSVLGLRIQGSGGGMVDNNIVGQYYSVGTGTYGLALNSNGTNVMNVLGSGNVGIGTASPTSSLHMINTTTTNTNPLLAIQGYNVGASGSGDVTRQAMINMSRLGTGGVQNNVSSQINLGSHSTAVINYSTIDFKLGGLPAAGNNYGSTPDVNVMTLTGQGYVGVGTTVPGYPLEIQGPGTTAGVSAYPYVGQLTLRAASNSAQKLVIGSYWTSGGGQGSYLQSSDQYSGAEHPTNISLNPNGGNVGIGTTNPIATLDVNGMARATGGFVSKTGGSSGTTSSFTFAPPNSSGHAILSISTVNNGYWFGYLFWTSVISSFTSVPIVSSAVTVSVNSITLLCSITSTSSGHRWNLTYFPVPDNGNTNNIY